VHTLYYYQERPAASMWLCRIIYKGDFLSTRMESRQRVCSAYERKRAAQIARLGGNRKVGECIMHAAFGGHCNF